MEAPAGATANADPASNTHQREDESLLLNAVEKDASVPDLPRAVAPEDAHKDQAQELQKPQQPSTLQGQSIGSNVDAHLLLNADPQSNEQKNKMLDALMAAGPYLGYPSLDAI